VDESRCKIFKMPSDLTPTAETEMIRAFVKLLAPSIHQVSCGSRLDGGYDLWLQLNPSSVIKQVVITPQEYSTEEWKETIKTAIEQINV
jgi:hypothetical protein